MSSNAITTEKRQRIVRMGIIVTCLAVVGTVAGGLCAAAAISFAGYFAVPMTLTAKTSAVQVCMLLGAVFAPVAFCMVEEN